MLRPVHHKGRLDDEGGLRGSNEHVDACRTDADFELRQQLIEAVWQQLLAVIETFNRARGIAPKPETAPKPIAELAEEAKAALATPCAAYDEAHRRLGLDKLEARQAETQEEVDRLEQAILAAEPSSIQDLAVLVDLALESNPHIDAQEASNDPKFAAVLRALRRLAPAVEFFSLLRDCPEALAP